MGHQKDTTYNVLIIDDNQADRELFKEYLQKGSGLRYAFYEAAEIRDAFEQYRAVSPQCIILDFLMLGGSDGLAFLMKLSDCGRKEVPVIFVTGYPSPQLFEDSTMMGASACFSKEQMNQSIFCTTVENIVRHHDTPPESRKIA